MTSRSEFEKRFKGSAQILGSFLGQVAIGRGIELLQSNTGRHFLARALKMLEAIF